MTQQHPNLNIVAPEKPAPGAEIPSRMGRLLGAWRARRAAMETSAVKTSQTAEEQDQDQEQPPVEWALRLMM
jgi:hypothetical protein